MRITPAGVVRTNEDSPSSPMGGILGDNSLGYVEGAGVSSTLQSTISVATSGVGTLPAGVVHHPITCQSDLGFDEEGTFFCSHYEVSPVDPRTKACLIHSVALLVIELGSGFDGMEELPYDRYEHE